MVSVKSGPRPQNLAPRGLTVVEVLVLLMIVSALVLVAMLALPRQREIARSVACRRNLMQVGVALALYDRDKGRLPTVPALVADPIPSGGPLKALLDALVLTDLTELSDVSTPPPPQPRPGSVATERPVRGFVCPSDPVTLNGPMFPAPVSYRGTTGDDPRGLNGGFAPGRAVTLQEIEDGDGRSFTAAFSERLHGRGGVARGLGSYQTAASPVGANGCPDSSDAAPRGDAGASWAEASWRSSLYNHALRPDASPSCVAADGASALMGASSAHAGGVNVLMFDGAVRTVSPTVAVPVWRALATTRGTPPMESR